MGLDASRGREKKEVLAHVDSVYKVKVKVGVSEWVDYSKPSRVRPVRVESRNGF